MNVLKAIISSQQQKFTGLETEYTLKRSTFKRRNLSEWYIYPSIVRIHVKKFKNQIWDRIVSLVFAGQLNFGNEK